ncbi:hypothetical protein BDY19DRAFT_910907 [Irpex rosettiformis]|uniref:Uncharacterized protein n=1 Tax=Irpex rosettiformis TaxID=378272 RepID=A0ACB8TM60_9APHY|nr:hypothetical protein BDY19DRAFT_910907 [Irpex rosettiformis]
MNFEETWLSVKLKGSTVTTPRLVVLSLIVGALERTKKPGLTLTGGYRGLSDETAGSYQIRLLAGLPTLKQYYAPQAGLTVSISFKPTSPNTPRHRMGTQARAQIQASITELLDPVLEDGGVQRPARMEREERSKLRNSVHGATQFVERWRQRSHPGASIHPHVISFPLTAQRTMDSERGGEIERPVNCQEARILTLICSPWVSNAIELWANECSAGGLIEYICTYVWIREFVEAVLDSLPRILTSTWIGPYPPSQWCLHQTTRKAPAKRYVLRVGYFSFIAGDLMLARPASLRFIPSNQLPGRVFRVTELLSLSVNDQEHHLTSGSLSVMANIWYLESREDQVVYHSLSPFQEQPSTWSVEERTSSVSVTAKLALVVDTGRIFISEFIGAELESSHNAERVLGVTVNVIGHILRRPTLLSSMRLQTLTLATFKLHRHINLKYLTRYDVQEHGYLYRRTRTVTPGASILGYLVHFEITTRRNIHPFECLSPRLPETMNLGKAIYNAFLTLVFPSASGSVFWASGPLASSSFSFNKGKFILKSGDDI